MSVARVTDDHLELPASARGSVVVTFDGRYVWSFVAPRDGERSNGGWRVDWPAALRPRLDGTTAVAVRGHGGAGAYFDEPVVFQGNPEALSLTDALGHPLAIDRAGHLSRVFDETDAEVRRHVVEGTARALADLRDQVGVDAHLSYGALLGAVREGRLIGHDSDTDLAYLSRYQHPADVIVESYRMEREMRALGWMVVRMSGADLKLFLPLPDGRNVHVDVFGGFYVDDTFYLLGGRSGTLPREALAPSSTVTLEGIELPAPADPERVLAFLYGESWRVPDPAFQNKDPESGLVRLDAWLRGFRNEVPQWNDFWRARRGGHIRAQSNFAEWVQAHLSVTTTVVDIGCGNGRDSVFFATRGHHVRAFDFSGAALRQTRRRLNRLGAEADVRPLLLDDARTTLLAGAELAREHDAPALYARQLVGCLSPDARRQLWRLSAMTLRRGGSLYLEFSDALDDAPPDAGPTAELVRRVDTAEVVAEIEAAGGLVVHRECGPGADFFDRPDPAVTRLEVRWDQGGHTMNAPTEHTTGRSSRFKRLLGLRHELRDLHEAVEENRRLNRRVAELTDVVAELLVPLADRDDEGARELLARYRESTLGPSVAAGPQAQGPDGTAQVRAASRA